MLSLVDYMESWCQISYGFGEFVVNMRTFTSLSTPKVHIADFT